MEPYQRNCALRNPFQRLILIKLLSIKQVARLIKVRLNGLPIAIAVSFPSAYVEPQPPLAIGDSALRSLEPIVRPEARCTYWSRKFELVMWRWHMRKDWFGSPFLADTLALACLFAIIAFATFW